MIKYFLGLLLLITVNIVVAQPKPKPNKSTGQPSPSDMNKMMEEAMQGMSEAEKAEMKKMMKDMMPDISAMSARHAEYPVFANNKDLVPQKQVAAIAALSAKKLLPADIRGYANNLYNNMLTKGNAEEMAIVKRMLARSSKPTDITSAMLLAMLQGHNEAALALSLKTVQADPANGNYQNNMAALLTQYGYAQQAIPVLQKLRTEYPGNSSILNNLGHAWLALGERDSAKKIISLAIRANPYHPEATLCGGLLKELSGDPVKAAEDYVRALENAPNTFAEEMLKNNRGQDQLSRIDFDKLKRSITIHEYFPEDWITIPLLSNSVTGYADDNATRNGHRQMHQQLAEKIETMMNEAGQDLQNLADKGQDEFVKTMAKETMKGVNLMSKPAVIVLKVLQLYQAKWMNDYAAAIINLNKTVEEHRKAMEKVTNKNWPPEQCRIPDNAINNYLQTVNPLIRKFYSEKAEEFRQWVNAYITWNWYVAGNPKNSVLMQDLGYVAAMSEIYAQVLQEQKTISSYCKRSTDQPAKPIAEPVIPNFTCPAIVRIPAGSEWQQLSNAAANFDNNAFTIKKDPGALLPNVTVGFGVNSRQAAQPGRDPFIKTSNGQVTPGGINDDELTPLPNLPNENDPVPLPDLRKSRLAKELLKKMMTTDCDNPNPAKNPLQEQLDRMMKSVKELEAYEELMQNISDFEKAAEELGKTDDEKKLWKKQIDRMKQEAEKMDKYQDMQQSKKDIEKLLREMDAMDEKKAFHDKTNKIQQLVDEMDGALPVLKEIRENGLQPSINSGVQAPGAFKPVKGMFGQ